MVIKIWHRGACWYAPENTLSSFQKALDLKVDMIELDIHVCKSWEIVVIHDELVNNNSFIKDMSLIDIQDIEIWKWERIPLLTEVLDLVWTQVDINIELKWENCVLWVVNIMSEYINNYWLSELQFYISSFRHRDLLEFHKLMPQIKISALLWHLPLNNAAFAEWIPYYSLNLDKLFISKEFIKDSHIKWFKVFVYTVDDIASINKMKDLWVDWIISNYPDRI